MQTRLLIASLLLIPTLSAIAQNQRSSISISDDDKTMSIRVEGVFKGRDIDYDQAFNVTGMTGREKEALKRRILDSLGVGEPPSPPRPPKPPRPIYEGNGDESLVLQCERCTGNMKLEVTGDGFTLTRSTDSGRKERLFPMKLSVRPGQYRLRYWQNDVLQMQQSFDVKAGQRNVVTVK